MNSKNDTTKMVFNKSICVQQCFSHKPCDMTFKAWKEKAAREIAEFIIKENCMTHHSRYDIAGAYTHEAFTVLVARPERVLP